MHAFWLVLTYDLLEDRHSWCHHSNFFPYILTLYYIKQIDSKLPCVCSVIDHRGGQNVKRTKKWHTRHSWVCHWCSYHILTSSVIYYWTDTWQLGIYLLDIHMNIVRTESMSVCRFGSNPNATPLLFLLDEIVCGFEFLSTSLLMARWTVSLEWEC